jgi:hypothetical protein
MLGLAGIDGALMAEPDRAFYTREKNVLEFGLFAVEHNEAAGEMRKQTAKAKRESKMQNT